MQNGCRVRIMEDTFCARKHGPVPTLTYKVLKAKRTAGRTGEDAKIPMYDIADAGGATKEMLGVIRERQWIERHICA